MTAPDDHLVRLLFALVLAIPSSYLAGRVHQWYMHSLRRDSAFQDGYNHASRAMFTLAVRHRTRGSGPAAPQPTVGPAPDADPEPAAVGEGGTRTLTGSAGRQPGRRRTVESLPGGPLPRRRTGNRSRRLRYPSRQQPVDAIMHETGVLPDSGRSRDLRGD